MSQPKGNGVTAEVLGWKLAGAFAWHGAAVAAAHLAWALTWPIQAHSFLRPTAVLAYLFLYLLQCASLAGHRAVLSASEYEPVTLLKLGVHGRTWISLFLTRVVVRGRTWEHATATTIFFAGNAAAAVAYLYVYPSAKLGAGGAAGLWWSLRNGLLLSVCYSCAYLLRGWDVLSYPVLQRHRWFRLKERAPQAFWTAVSMSAAALALAYCTGQGAPSGRALYGIFVGATLCVFCWAMGHHVLHVVFTEKLQLVQTGEADPNGPLLAVLSSSSTIVQDLGLLDVAAMSAGDGGSAAWRRAAIFMDETGRAAWTPLAYYMHAEIGDFARAVAAALPNAAAEAASAAAAGRAGNAGPASVRWNVLRLSPSTGMRLVSREQDLAAWNVRSKYYRLTWCLRGLSGLAVAAQRGEDRYGVVLLCEPTLPDITAGLLSIVLVLQQYIKLMVASRSRQASLVEGLARQAGLVSTAVAGRTTNITLQPVEEVAFALEATARTCINRMALAYGERLRDVLRDAKSKVAYGSPAELASLLGAILACQELS